MRIEAIINRFAKEGYTLTQNSDGSWTATKGRESVTEANLNALFREVFR